MKTRLYRVRIIKGFAAGRVCMAQKVIEDGATFYRCCPAQDFWIDYPEDYVELV